MISIEEIKPYENNAKEHNEKQVKQIAASIKKFGFNQPIVVDKENVVIVGHGRLLAAKHLGIKSAKIGEAVAPVGADFVPVIKLTNISDDDAKAYRLGDNKLNESPWIADKVIAELKDLDLKGVDITLTGFTRDFISDVQEDDFDAEKEYAGIKEPKTKQGDIYELGTHRIMCGDSTSEKDFEKLMGGGQGQYGVHGSTVRRKLPLSGRQYVFISKVWWDWRQDFQ